MADVTFGAAIVYNGGDGKAHEIAFITNIVDPDPDARIVNCLAFDGDGNGEIKTGVPYRSPADYEAGGGGGHTWHWDEDRLNPDD